MLHKLQANLTLIKCFLFFSGILKFYQEDLLDMDFIRLGQFLSKLPDDIPAASLFQAIASINLMEQKFSQTLAMQKEVAAQIKNVTSPTKWKNIYWWEFNGQVDSPSTWVALCSKMLCNSIYKCTIQYLEKMLCDVLSLMLFTFVACTAPVKTVPHTYHVPVCIGLPPYSIWVIAQCIYN